ncbi:MAG TPA: type II toxin-antitoxin system VapC family toxin [Methylocystis sp.]|nr:type II toxin-antitoxin system VapC family toxin [Methylocystis sp.]
MRGTLMVETSALVAILLEEEGWRGLAEQIAETRAITTCVNMFEASLALTRERRHKTTAAYEIVEAAVQNLDIQPMAIFPAMIPLAAEARERFGAGRYGLNMGDCLSYAAAKHFRARLLYAGKDFTRTDVND